jgi:hypothetical protein
MATELIKWTIAGGTTILRLNTPNFKITSIERIQCGGYVAAGGTARDYCSSGAGTPDNQVSLDTESRTETTGRVLKAAANGQTVVEVSLPANAFATTGRLTLTNHVYTTGMQVCAKLIGDLI